MYKLYVCIYVFIGECAPCILFETHKTKNIYMFILQVMRNPLKPPRLVHGRYYKVSPPRKD